MKTIWLYAVLIIVILVGAACSAQSNEEVEATEGQQVTLESLPQRPVEAEDASTAVEAQAEADEPLLLWQGPALFAEDQTECHQLTISAGNQALVGLCTERGETAAFLAAQNQTWGDILARFAPFETQIGDQRLAFRGQGEIGGPAWERAIAAWASLTYAELGSGRISASGPTVLAWNLGEVADQPGNCRQLIVLVYGYALAGTIPCAGGSTQGFSGDWIDSAAWEQFDAWLYANAPVYQDNNYLAGRGADQMSQADIEALAAWAETVYEQLNPIAVAPAESSQAAVSIGGL